MEAITTQFLKHMLEAADARAASPLFAVGAHWERFGDWCEQSQAASRLLSQFSGEIETLCIDSERSLYCMAMSVETMEKAIHGLVTAYEDTALMTMFA